MKKDKKNTGSIVYSTNPSFDFAADDEDATQTLPASKQDLRVWLDRKLKGGKTATVIRNFVGKQEDLENLGKLLKQKCGTGGAVKNSEIIIQGDHREKIISILDALGYKSKKAGG